MEAGPSTLPAKATKTTLKTKKPRAPHPSKPLPNQKRKKLQPPLPPKPDTIGKPKPKPTLPIKTLQGVGTRRTDSTKPGYGREVVFVTRKTGLGMLLGRCKSLVIDEGYTHLTFHAMTAAIPQALLLLHSLMDVLPFPRGPRGMWYQIKTGSVSCIDEIEPFRPMDSGSTATPSSKSKGKRKKTKETGEVEDITMEGTTEDPLDKLLEGIGNVEAAKTERVVRTNSTIQIDLYIGPLNPSDDTIISNQPRRSAPGKGKSRPNKRQREAIAAARAAAASGQETGVPISMEGDEEEMMNMMVGQNAVAIGRQDLGEVISRSSIPKSGVAGTAGAQECQEEEIEEVEEVEEVEM